ncbi:MAG: hypothetical protein K2X72_01585 [Reyranella sp.]|nr:hypothetical protein [Reyranella sp.]
MPINWTISHDERLVLATAEGLVTLPEIEEYFDSVIVAGAQPYAKLFDGTNMELHLTDNDVMAVGARVSAYVNDKKWTGGPAAFVVTTRVNREFVRRYINLSASPRQVQMFETVEKARAWLGEQQG